MKNIVLLFITGFMVFTSCKDESKAPIITFDQAGKGAYVRLLNVNEGTDGFNLTEYSTTAFDFDVEFVDEQAGDLVATYTIFVSYAPSPFSSTPAVAEIQYFTQDAGSFIDTDRGYKGTNVRVPLSDVATKMGLSESDLGGADRFLFRSEIVLQDGSVFQFSNSSSAVNGSAFQGHFNFAVNLSCPITDDQFVGDYTLTHVSGEFAFGTPPFGEDGGIVNLSKVSNTKRSFDYTYLPGLGIGNDPVDFIFEIICTIVVPDDGQDTNLACGGGILVGGSSTTFGSVDVSDDSSFMIDIENWQDDGGCGVPQTVVRIQLDKK